MLDSKAVIVEDGTSAHTNPEGLGTSLSGLRLHQILLCHTDTLAGHLEQEVSAVITSPAGSSPHWGSPLAAHRVKGTFHFIL